MLFSNLLPVLFILYAPLLTEGLRQWGGGGGGGRPGEKGAGGIREVGKDVAGSGRKREKLRNIAQYFAIEKMQKAEAKK